MKKLNEYAVYISKPTKANSSAFITRALIENYYHDKPREKKKLSQEKEFRQIKNAVIQEAECVRLGEISFEDNDLTECDEPEPAHDES